MNRNVEDEAAAGAAARPRCSAATLRGTYLFAYDGFVIEGDEQVPFAVASREVFDGNGKTEGVFSANLNGDVTSPPQHFSGTYTVKADCTGTSTYPDGSQYDLFIDRDGSMFTFVQTNPPEVVASGGAQRVTRR